MPVKQLELLARGELDIALIDNGDIHAAKFPVTIQALMKEDFVLAVNESNYKKWTLRDSTFGKLCEIPFVDCLTHAPVTKMWFKHHFSKVPSNLKVKYSAENVQAVLNAIKSGLGAGVVPSHLISDEFADLKIISTTKKPFINEIMLARQQGCKPTAREKEFTKFLKLKIS